MLPDVLSAALRALGFVAVLQAGGAALFLAVFAEQAEAARPQIQRLVRAAAVAAAALLVAQYLLEPARMSGELSGVFDAQLQAFALQSRAALVLAMRLAGLALVAWSLRSSGPGVRISAVSGAALIALSFPLTGHTPQHPARWLLMPLLSLHLLVVQYWFGSLLPLALIAGCAPAALCARVLEGFSRGATWLVPMVFVAGLVMAARLLPDLAALWSPYGIGLLLKVLLFALLMCLAALNKWRLGPALLLGGRQARLRLQRCIVAEFVLILLALMGTATLTLFWSPET